MDVVEPRMLRASDAATLARFAAELHDQRGVENAVEQILEFAVRAIPCAHAGLMLGLGKEVERAFVSDPWLRRADQLQLDHDDGPYLAMPGEGDSVRVPDTSVDTWWPRWSPQVAELGLRSVLSYRLRDGRANIGTFALYVADPGRFDAREAEMAQMVSRHAAIAIATVQYEDKLRRAVELRTFIGQAQGILMERFGLDPVQAFAILRRSSRTKNVSVGEAAWWLVSTGDLPADGFDHAP